MVQNRRVTTVVVDRQTAELRAHTIQHPSAVDLIKPLERVSGPQGIRTRRVMRISVRSAVAAGNLRQRRHRRATSEIQVGHTPPTLVSVKAPRTCCHRHRYHPYPSHLYHLSQTSLQRLGVVLCLLEVSQLCPGLDHLWTMLSRWLHYIWTSNSFQSDSFGSLLAHIKTMRSLPSHSLAV
jgi:hypothetical protein